MKRNETKSPQQLDLLSQDVRSTEQVLMDLVARRDKINSCLKLADEITDLLNLDAERLLQDVRSVDSGNPSEITKANTKRNGHLSLESHQRFSTIFTKNLRETNEEGLIFLRDALAAMEEVVPGVGV